MPPDLISRRTRREFREWMVSWTLREIEETFSNENLDPDLAYTPPEGGQRRSLIEQYYHAIDFTSWEGVKPLLGVYQLVLDSAKKLNPDSYSTFVIQLERDGFKIDHHRILFQSGRTALSHVGQLAERIDATYIRTQIIRIEESIEDDPALAIGSAKELVETTCKTILNETGANFDSAWDVPKLVKETLKQLKLAPEDVRSPTSENENAKKAVEAMRQMLQNLGAIAGRLAELRNAVGTGHGPDGRVRGPRPRHARLAVHAAAALITFMFETHEIRSSSGS